MREVRRRVLEDVRNYGRGVLLAVLYVSVGAFGVPVCPMVLMTGLPCPGCGMTRAAALFLKGDWLGAWRMHPFFYALLILLLLAAFYRYALGRPAPGMRFFAPAALTLAIAFYGRRMALYFPDREPMVYFKGNALSFLTQLVAQLRQIC